MNASNALFYRLIANRCEIEEFEQQLYSMADIEERLSELDYLNLISIDYRLPSAAYEALEIINKYVDSSRYHEWYLGSLLTRIIDRTADVHEAIEECYHLCCIGLGFLHDLGLGYGLAIIAPPKEYFASDWYGLPDIEKEGLVDGMYPGIVPPRQSSTLPVAVAGPDQGTWLRQNPQSPPGQVSANVRLAA